MCSSIFFSVTDILCLPVPNPWQFSLYLKRLLYHPTIFRLSGTGVQLVTWVILPPFWSLVNLHSLDISLEKMNLGKGYLDRLSLAPSWFSCRMEPCVQACSVSVFFCLLLVKHTARSHRQIVISVELRICSFLTAGWIVFLLPLM